MLAEYKASAVVKMSWHGDRGRRPLCRSRCIAEEWMRLYLVNGGFSLGVQIAFADALDQAEVARGAL